VRNLAKGFVGAAVLFGGSVAALAQSSFSFEAPLYTGSAAGTVITGQDGWFVPAVGGEHGFVSTYSSNRFGIGVNPSGGAQFAVAQRNNINFTRAQRAVQYGSNGTTGCVTVCYDFNGRFDSDEPFSDPNGPANNLASVSVQQYPANGCIFLHIWDDPNLGVDATHSLSVTGFFANGTQIAGRTIIFPGSQFSNIPQNQWMRACIDMDLDTNAITRLEIGQVCAAPIDRDVVAVDDPNFGFYLGGGAAGVGPVNEIRLFGGGGGTVGFGNTMAMDNLATGTPCAYIDGPPCGPAGCPNPGCDDPGADADFDGNCQVNLTDLGILLANFGGPATNATGDANGDGLANLTDLGILLARFGSNCN
jgi:hypothetical protein